MVQIYACTGMVTHAHTHGREPYHITPRHTSPRHALCAAALSATGAAARPAEQHHRPRPRAGAAGRAARWRPTARRTTDPGGPRPALPGRPRRPRQRPSGGGGGSADGGVQVWAAVHQRPPTAASEGPLWKRCTRGFQERLGLLVLPCFIHLAEPLPLSSGLCPPTHPKQGSSAPPRGLLC